MGIGSEAGEIMENVKRSKIHNIKLDKSKLIHDMGDLMWYLAILCDDLGVSFEEVWEKNIKMLKKRFPKGFSSNHLKTEE